MCFVGGVKEQGKGLVLDLYVSFAFFSSICFLFFIYDLRKRKEKKRNKRECVERDKLTGVTGNGADIRT